MQMILKILGFIFLALGIIGIVLPLLPTTPFLLLSAFCFARSSEKLHDWLLHHPYFGPTIKDWREHGSISKRNKTYAIVTILITFLLSVILEVPLVVILIQMTVLSIVSLFILTRPQSS
ncbi:MAG: YbaN family protein [Alphaproteobacteria bacterium]|nr:YbaN family protein [Alphaproteobacteria bacterium]